MTPRARDILENPPYWIRDAYLPGYRKGTISLNILAGAVAAAQGRSPYEWADRLLPEVREAVSELGLSSARTATPAVWA